MIDKANYRALMIREDCRTEIEKAMRVFEKINGHRPTYSMFLTRLAHQYIFEQAEQAAQAEQNK